MRRTCINLHQAWQAEKHLYITLQTLIYESVYGNEKCLGQ